ncbi:MAG TPA: CehA/McbA family metallohydrolase [Chryseosolibacter sp.]
MKGPLLLPTALVLMALSGYAQLRIDSTFYHLRNAEPREWNEFPEKAFAKELVIEFEVSRAEIPTALSLRQYDVKLPWMIELNGHYVGTLVEDEKDLMAYHLLEPSMLTIGTNTIRIYSKETVADDIRVGELTLHTNYQAAPETQAFLILDVVDENNNSLPAHLTICNEKRVLQSFATNRGTYAARPGHLYTATGKATLVIPAGSYVIFAGRGFEYSIDSVSVKLNAGDSITHTFRINREVDTNGWISTDTHVHTYTHSQHGDATDRERVITLAGEGIELPIITDHNQHVDLRRPAQRAKVDRYFTLVMGNEVTSKVGHFNVFPIDSTESVKSSTGPNWTELGSSIERYRRPKVIILNHARDIHNNFRPHDPSRLLAIAGQRLDGEPLFANALEVVNSGSQQSDWMQLFNDWMHLLNGGHELTPIGSSDSHDVSRFIVGQGRTYVRANDSSPDAIDLHEVVDHFINGKVMVSCGLLASLEINGSAGPGDLAAYADEIIATIKVSGPAWSKADKVKLYINGEKFKEEKIIDKGIPGVKWSSKWILPKSAHDYHVVAIAEGPADHMVFWPIAKPYQPTSADWTPGVIGASGAVWVDADGNGKRDSANDYAKKIISQASNNITAIVASLQHADEAVAVQVAALLHLNKVDLTSRKIQRALKNGSEKTRSGFETVIAELKQSNTQ